MKLKKVLKSAIFYGAVVAFLNYSALPISSCVAVKVLKNDAKNKKIQKICQTDQHLENIISSIDTKTCDALPILKAAHALTSKKLDYNYSFWSNIKLKVFEKGEADCKYFSLFTYNNFLYLADKVGRPGLKDKVRLRIGFGYDNNQVYYGHVWLQVLVDGKWRDYETTVDFIGKNEKIDFKKLNERLPDQLVLYDATALTCSYMQYEDGLLKDHTNFAFSIETGADLKSCWYLLKNDILGL